MNPRDQSPVTAKMPGEDKPECDLDNHEDWQDLWLKSQNNWLRGR